MMTKKEFAEQIVLEFCEREGIAREDAHSYIFSSSRLAVALEFLGELSGIEKTYAAGRGGTEYRHLVFQEDGQFEDLHIISTREMLSLLPDEIEKPVVTLISSFSREDCHNYTKAIKEWEAKKKADSRKLFIEKENEAYKLYLSISPTEPTITLSDFWQIYNNLTKEEE